MPKADSLLTPKYSWWRELNRYHWWILIVCSLGWLFDTMDQRIFTQARGPAMTELVTPRYKDWSEKQIMDEVVRLKQKIEPNTPAEKVRSVLIKRKSDDMGRLATTIFILGWATGGIIFGIMGDRLGRARTMLVTILVYAIFTAASGLSVGIKDFMAYRFLTGLGVGGEFSAGVALLSEVMPQRSRPYALAFMQGLSALGNMIGSSFAFVFAQNSIGWRYLFFVGVIPAIFALAIRRRLQEPESWMEAKEAERTGEGLRLGSYADLFSNPRWRRNALVGATLAVVGVTGVWGIGFYSPELVGRVLEARRALGQLTDKDVARWKTIMPFCQDIGAFISMFGFAYLAERIGRKPSFHFACLAGMAAVMFVFGTLSAPWQIVPYGFILGLGTMVLFGGYAVYFPEIFPTRLRSTGVSFCYNVGRYLASVINLIPIAIFGIYSRTQEPLISYRYTAMTMALLYLVGNVAVFFAPETNGEPLPTEEEPAAA